MPCCKSYNKFDGWCKDLKTVYVDEEGNEYCVFHAPKGKKGISLDEFNALVFQKIEDTKKANRETPKEPQACDLLGTIFEGNINFSQKGLPSVNFFKAQFTAKANFEDATFTDGADFANVTFTEKAFFRDTQFIGEAYFWNAQFTGEASFEDAQFTEKSSFNSTIFSKRIIFSNVALSDEKLFFENVNLEKVCFVNTDVRKINFINCTWNEKNGHRIVYDEELITPLAGIVECLKNIWRIPKDREHNIKRIETVYRRLKQRYREDHNEPEASIWHYSEREMQRKRSCLRYLFDWLFTHLYWISSGYGERPLRSFVVLLVLLGTACIILPFFPLQGNGIAKDLNFTGWISTFSSKEHVKAVVLSVFQYLTFQRETILSPNTLDGAFIKYAAQFFIPIQAALFFFALRNRFRK